MSKAIVLNKSLAAGAMLLPLIYMSIIKYLSIILFIVSFAVASQAKAAYSYIYLSKLSDQRKPYDSIEWKNLLHYDGNKSVINHDSPFFFSQNGYKDPKQEYTATLKRFLEESMLTDQHAICVYPARFRYIIDTLKLNKSYFPNPKCLLYNEYLEKVPINEVSISFAAENTTSPSSMMGHSFLKISGISGEVTREHAFSYFAWAKSTETPSFYVKTITSGVDGVYALSSYKSKENIYLNNDKRSIWEFGLLLTFAQREKLKDHLWELKEKNIRYSFIDHNCNTALIRILAVANNKYESKIKKPFITPVEYIQELHKRNLVTNVSIIPTKYTAEKIHKNRLGNLLSMPKPARLSASYENYRKDYLNFEFSPVYQDIRDITDNNADELESKMISLDAGLNIRSGRAFVRSVDIIKMKSILDYSISNDFSKYFKFSMENNLGEEKTRPRPTIEAGLGLGHYINNFTFYIMPKVGYRYNEHYNLYISPEVGFIARPTKRIKFITNYSPYFNTQQNNRGYQSEVQFYTGYSLSNKNEVYLRYSIYSDAIEKNRILAGFTTHF